MSFIKIVSITWCSGNVVLGYQEIVKVLSSGDLRREVFIYGEGRGVLSIKEAVDLIL